MKSTKKLIKITNQKMKCPNKKCGLVTTVLECIPDIDGDGGLGCPRCWYVLREITIMEMRKR